MDREFKLWPERFNWGAYAFSLLIVAASGAATAAVYSKLPAQIATRFDAFGKPVGGMPKDAYCTMIGVITLATIALMLGVDRWLAFPSPFPVPMLGWVTVWVTLMIALLHVGTILFALGRGGNPGVYFLVPFVGGLIAFQLAGYKGRQRRKTDQLSEKAEWVSAPKPVWWLRLLVLPFMSGIPDRVELHPQGVRLVADLYDLRYAYEIIESCEAVSFWKSATKKMSVNLSLNPATCVRMGVRGARMSVTFSAEPREEFVERVNARISGK